jgi:hypothetical protein
MESACKTVLLRHGGANRRTPETGYSPQTPPKLAREHAKKKGRATRPAPEDASLTGGASGCAAQRDHVRGSARRCVMSRAAAIAPDACQPPCRVAVGRVVQVALGSVRSGARKALTFFRGMIETTEDEQEVIAKLEADGLSKRRRRALLSKLRQVGTERSIDVLRANLRSHDIKSQVRAVFALAHIGTRKPPIG